MVCFLFFTVHGASLKNTIFPGSGGKGHRFESYRVRQI